MKTYNPGVRVWLIKNRVRKDIIDGQKVSFSRYGGLGEIDLTRFLGQNGMVETSKSVRQPAGTFALSFPDAPYGDESVYALAEPMDMVEIRMSHTGAKDSYGDYPLIMRGFVSDISRTESIQDGRPVRIVKITGHDYGKVLQIIRVMYQTQSILGENWLGVFKWFDAYVKDTDAKTKLVKEFVPEAVEGVVNKYLADITRLATPVYRARVIHQLSTNVTVDGSISAFTPSQYDEMSLHQMLKTILDVPVFNEMYTEDSEAAVTLVVRPTPLKDLSTSGFIQGATDSKDIHDVDMAQITASRSDGNVANFFWVTSPAFFLDINQVNYLSSLSEDPAAKGQLSYLNSDLKMFGIRKMEVQTVLLPDSYAQTPAPTREMMGKNEISLEEWLRERRSLLTRMNKDNVILESGTLSLRGDEAIRPGTYLRLHRSGRDAGEVYAHTVAHKMALYGGFTTTVTFDRGTLFYERSKAGDSMYYDDVNGGGAAS